MSRLTFGWPNGSAWSRLLRIRTATPWPAKSRCRFSVAVATIRLISAFSCDAGRPQRPRNADSGDSVRTPGPPKIAVLTPRAVEVEEDRLGRARFATGPGR